MEKLNLPDGWTEGANPFVTGGAAARANLTWQKTVQPKGFDLSRICMYEVRYAFDPDGYRAFAAVRTVKTNAFGRRLESKPAWTWQAYPNCPTFDNPVACMVWLEIDRAAN